MLMVEYKLSIYGFLLTAMTYIDLSSGAHSKKKRAWNGLGTAWNDVV